MGTERESPALPMLENVKHFVVKEQAKIVLFLPNFGQNVGFGQSLTEIPNIISFFMLFVNIWDTQFIYQKDSQN
jgi:hypothetical protein